MIKEKELMIQRCTTEGEYMKTDCFNVMDPQMTLNISVVEEILSQYLKDNNIPATITEDVLSYKTGFLKSETTPCLIVAHNGAPKDFAKMVLVIRHSNGSATFMTGWYGLSKNDKKIQKLQKGVKKADRRKKQSAKTDDMLEMIGKGGAYVIQNEINLIKYKKIIQRTEIENEFHYAICDAANYVGEQLRGMVE